MSQNPSSFTPTPYEPSAPASFTPTQGNYKNLQPFRYWCQKVLPLVYDDSLSYYELLCKVVDYLNKTMEDVETLHDDVDNLHTAYGELQEDYNTKYAGMTEWINQSYQDLVTFVNTYFANLDVQEEINNKLDIMASDGTLSALVAPYVPAQVDAWLEEHITNPSNPPIDTSLSLQNAVAPSNITGNNQNAIKMNYDSVASLITSQLRGNKNIFDGFYKNVFIDSSTGIESNYLNTNYLSSKNYLPVNSGTLTIKIPSNLRTSGNTLWVFKYNASKEYITYQYFSSTTPESVTMNIDNTTKYIRFMFISSNKPVLTAENTEIYLNYIDPKYYRYNQEITSGDLNDFRSAGSYNIDTEQATNISNLPISTGGTLLVIPSFGGNANHVAQIYLTANRHMYLRFVLNTGSAFGAWREIGYDYSGDINAIWGNINRNRETDDYIIKNQLGGYPNLFDSYYINKFIDSSTGAEGSDNANYLSSKNYIPVNGGVANFIIPSSLAGKALWVYLYDNSYNYINYSYNANVGSSVNVTLTSATKYIKFMFTGDTAINKDTTKEVIIYNNYVDPKYYRYRQEITSGDLNDFRSAGSYNIDSEQATNISNLPVSTGGTLLVIPSFGGSANHVAQIYMTANRHMYLRFVLNTGSAFGAWREIGYDYSSDINNCLKKLSITSASASSTYGGKLYNLPVNSYGSFSYSWFDDCPFNVGWYTIFTLSSTQNTGNTEQRIQLLYTGTGASGTNLPTESVIAIRHIINNSTIGEWRYLKFKDVLNYPTVMRYFAFGDSVCRGNHPDSTKSDYAYPETFGKLKDNLIVQNKAIGGQGYMDTRYAVKALTTIQATDITNANLITLAFGINDASNSDLPIGTINDTGDTTIMGNVYQCIEYIYSQTPKVQLVICGTTKQSGVWSTRLAELNEKLKGIAEKYGIAFIDMSESPINQFNGTSSDGLTTDGTHFNDDGYILLGQYMCGKLSAIFGY